MRVEYSKDSFIDILFDRNSIEPPIFYNNPGKALRFDLINKPEKDNFNFLNSIFDDLFVENSHMYVVFFGARNSHWKTGHYFKPFSLKKILKHSYVSRDKDVIDEKPYVVVCQTRRKYFNSKKYFMEYLNNELKSSMLFLSRKLGAIIQFYDNRGVDLLCEEKDFRKTMFERYEKYIIEYDREEIVANLRNI